VISSRAATMRANLSFFHTGGAPFTLPSVERGYLTRINQAGQMVTKTSMIARSQTRQSLAMNINPDYLISEW
ncbi:MAG: hypothetical protein MUO19_08560, partial [Dehalococcoidales bacterium]|nr:hypothetical protein [Dehalococcoidales bacterium]